MDLTRDSYAGSIGRDLSARCTTKDRLQGRTLIDDRFGAMMERPVDNRRHPIGLRREQFSGTEIQRSPPSSQTARAMSVSSREQFVACLRKSGVVDTSKLDPWLELVTDADPGKIANKLIRDNLITKWQAKYLLSGRSRLSVGNYRLLSRISRDELGDRFEAIHANLDRRVVIQIFPPKLGSSDATREEVLQIMQGLTELDHAGLIHVYDVDREADRYFIVTEYFDAVPLSQIARDKIDDVRLAKSMAMVTSGIGHAHESDIQHGDITQDHILLKPSGEAKLQGLSTASVRAKIAGLPELRDADIDITAISQIGMAVAAELPTKRRSEGYDRLVQLFQSAGATPQPTAQQLATGLERWLDQFQPAEPVATPTAKSPVSESTAAVSPSASSANESVSASRVKHSRRSTDANLPSPSSASNASFPIRMWKEQRPASIAALCGLVLIAAATAYGATWLAMGNNDRGNHDSEVAQGSLNATEPGQTPIVPPRVAQSESASQSASEKAPETLEVPAPDFNDASDSAIVESIDTALDAAADGPVESASAELPASDSMLATTVEPEPPLATQTAAMAEPTPESEESPDEPEEEKTAATNANDERNNETSEETSSAIPGLADLPESVDLPALGETDDMVISALQTDPSYLLAMELIAEPQIAKAKHEFELRRDENDRQLWNVLFRNRGRGDGVAVAQIQKSEEQLVFRWLPDAAADEEANYFRNCELILIENDQRHFMAMRKPMEIENFRFDEGASVVSVELELPWPPNVKAIQTELQQFKVNKGQELLLLPARVQKKSPGIIFFNEKPEDRVFAIEVSGDTRKAIKLQARMMVMLGNGSWQPLKKASDINGYGEMMSARQAVAQQKSDVAAAASSKDSPLNYDQFQDFKRQLKKAAALAADQVESAIAARELVMLLSGQPIPFEVYIEMSGHRIVLARSVAE